LGPEKYLLLQNPAARRQSLGTSSLARMHCIY